MVDIRPITTGIKNKDSYRNWKSRVPTSDRKLYVKIQKAIDEAEASLGKLTEDQLRLTAEAILRLRNEQLKLIYKYDFERFVNEIFTGVDDSSLQDFCDTPDFHIELYNAYEEHDRVCGVCPRGHGKSSTARIWILHKILYNKCRYVVMIGSSEDMAGQNLRWIRDQLVENSKIIDIYGSLYNKAKWAETEFITSTKIKMVAKGAGQKIRGMNEKGRPDIVYIDDLEDDEMVTTKERRDKVSLWFRQAVLPIISQKAKIIYTGTILDGDSLLKNVSKNLIKDHIKWKVLFYQAVNVDSNGKMYALWEERKPLEILLIIKQDDPETFAKEYQNDPRAGGLAVFQKQWYNHYDERSLIEFRGEYTMNANKLSVMCHTDFALSEKKSSDFSVIMITGMDEKTNLYVLDYLRWRTADPYDMLNKMFIMCQKWNTDVATMEVVAFQTVLSRMFDYEMDRRNIIISIIELTRPASTKLKRIKSLASPIQKG